MHPSPILVYSIDDVETFETIEKTLENLSDKIDVFEIPVALVGNKSDLDRATLYDDGQDLCQKHHIKIFLELSAKEIHKGLPPVFERIVDKIFKVYKEKGEDRSFIEKYSTKEWRESNNYTTSGVSNASSDMSTINNGIPVSLPNVNGTNINGTNVNGTTQYGSTGQTQSPLSFQNSTASSQDSNIRNGMNGNLIVNNNMNNNTSSPNNLVQENFNNGITTMDVNGMNDNMSNPALRNFNQNANTNTITSNNMNNQSNNVNNVNNNRQSQLKNNRVGKRGTRQSNNPNPPNQNRRRGMPRDGDYGGNEGYQDKSECVIC